MSGKLTEGEQGDGGRGGLLESVPTSRRRDKGMRPRVLSLARRGTSTADGRCHDEGVGWTYPIAHSTYCQVASDLVPRQWLVGKSLKTEKKRNHSIVSG